MTPQQFRKKPIVIDAMQVNSPEDAAAAAAWINDQGGDAIFLKYSQRPYFYELKILTLEGNLDVSEGDWVIQGIAGEFYPCKPDIFAATYEVAE